MQLILDVRNLMEHQILQELQTIRYLMVAQLAILAAMGAFWIFFVIFNLRLRTPQFRDAEKGAYLIEVRKLLDDGEFERAAELSWNRSCKYPQDPFPLWYLGLARFKNRDFGMALSAFENLRTLDAAWEKVHVSDYIEECRRNLKGPLGPVPNR